MGPAIRSAIKQLKRASISLPSLPPGGRSASQRTSAPISRPSVPTPRVAYSIAITPSGTRLAPPPRNPGLKRLGSSLPRVRNAVKEALASPGLTRTKVVAAIVRLIDHALLRPGYEEYARREGGRGASTLLKSDVSVNGDQVVLMFKGKGGKEIRRELRDPLLARVLHKLSAAKGQRLFSLPDGKGGEPVTAREVNEFLAEASGSSISVKDFRTFRASATALAVLTEHNGHESEVMRKKAIVAAADEASKILVNTRSVARSSYIHPSVIEAYEAGKLKTSVLRGRVRKGLSRIESALMRFLEKTS